MRKWQQYCFFVLFFGSGVAKLLNFSFEINAFERWGYPLWFMYLTGGVEVGCGVATMYSSVRQHALLICIILMTGAFITHLLHVEHGMLTLSSIILMSLVYFYSKEKITPE